MKHILDTESKEQIIREIRSFFERSFPELKMVYLHGSFVSDAAFSDIDIAILSDPLIEDALAFEFEIEDKLGRQLKLPVDVRLLNAAPLSFRYNVIKNKRIVIDRDPNHRADFESITLREYFDFAQFQKRYLKEVLNAPI